MKAIRAVEYWFTIEERGIDRRTGARVSCRERLRRPNDKPGKDDTVWDWYVTVEHAHHFRRTNGTSQNQKGARAAIRRVVRDLPDKESDGGKSEG